MQMNFQNVICGRSISTWRYILISSKKTMLNLFQNIAFNGKKFRLEDAFKHWIPLSTLKGTRNRWTKARFNRSRQEETVWLLFTQSYLLLGVLGKKWRNRVLSAVTKSPSSLDSPTTGSLRNTSWVGSCVLKYVTLYVCNVVSTWAYLLRDIFTQYITWMHNRKIFIFKQNDLQYKSSAWHKKTYRPLSLMYVIFYLYKIRNVQLLC